MTPLQIKQIDYHRNGISGIGFYAVLFLAPSENNMTFLASVFPEDGAVSVICLDRIAEYGVTFGPNSWRGDHFEPELRAAIETYQKERFDI